MRRHLIRAWPVTLGTLIAATVFLGACSESTEPPRAGNVQVAITTTGAELDPDGYTASIDGQSHPVLINASATLENIPAGVHQVELSGLAANCALVTPAPVEVTVVAGTTVTVSLAVTCSATTGALRVAVTTTGRDLDTDGYIVGLDGGAPRTIAVNGSITFSGLTPETHTLQLGGAASNCEFVAPPAGATVTAGIQTDLTLAVVCTGPLRDAIVFAARGQPQDQLFVVSANGSGGERLTHDDLHAYFKPVVSPDGLEIAFLSNRPDGGTAGLFVMKNDGSGVRPVVTTGPAPVLLSWTPDGRIVFAQVDQSSQAMELCFIQPDGTGRACIVPEGGRLFSGDFALSPDGQRIIYTDGPLEFVIMDADGTDVQSVFFPGGENHGVDWSPDGQRIAFTRVEDLDGDQQFDTEVYVMNIDGTNPVRLTEGGVMVEAPRWSPDGQQILFLSRMPNGDSELRVMSVGGTNNRKLTAETTGQRTGRWSPIQ